MIQRAARRMAVSKPRNLTQGMLVGSIGTSIGSTSLSSATLPGAASDTCAPPDVGVYDAFGNLLSAPASAPAPVSPGGVSVADAAAAAAAEKVVKDVAAAAALQDVTQTRTVAEAAASRASAVLARVTTAMPVADVTQLAEQVAAAARDASSANDTAAATLAGAATLLTDPTDAAQLTQIREVAAATETANRTAAATNDAAQRKLQLFKRRDELIAAYPHSWNPASISMFAQTRLSAPEQIALTTSIKYSPLYASHNSNLNITNARTIKSSDVGMINALIRRFVEQNVETATI